MPEGKLRDKYCKKLPALVFLDSTGEEMFRMAGKKRASSIYGGMKKSFKKHYAPRMGTQVKKLSEWLEELEKAEDKMADAQRFFDAEEERAADRDDERSKKRVAEKKAELETAQKAFEKVEKQGEQLANPPLKKAQVLTRK